MSQFNTSGDKGYVATAALGDGVLVKIASGNVVVSTAATDKTIGVTVGTTAIGGMANVHLLTAQGSSRVKLGGTVAVGDYLVSNATGLAITGTQAIAGAIATGRVVGQALEAGVSGDIIESLNVTFLF